MHVDLLICWKFYFRFEDVNTGPLAKEMDPMFTESRSVGLAQDDSYVILEELRETSRRSLMLSVS